uniref:Uncharacterized protein n=1 Tax=Arundo donax TaxID=35708 RepID=A0A0A8YEW3_ARUDO
METTALHLTLKEKVRTMGFPNGMQAQTPSDGFLRLCSF